jgi:hypothetical protein
MDGPQRASAVMKGARHARRYREKGISRRYSKRQTRRSANGSKAANSRPVQSLRYCANRDGEGQSKL